VKASGEVARGSAVAGLPMAGDEGGWLYGGRVAVHDLTARAGEWVRCATCTHLACLGADCRDVVRLG
jgi:hypothetical protein